MKPLVAVLLLAVTIYAFVDWARTPDSRMKAVPKPLWFFAILLLPLLGPIVWLVAGKTETPEGATTAYGPGVAPDDDPAFLRKLRDEEWKRRRRQDQESEAPSADRKDDDEEGGSEEPPTAAV